MKTIIISGADAAFWPLLSGLLHSIRPHQQVENIALGILDGGLEQHQVSFLRSLGAAVVTPGWDIPVDHLNTLPNSTIKMLTARPWLPRYFPGYDLYIWLDADCWVQDWEAVRLLMRAAVQCKFSLIPQVYRSYSPFLGDGGAYLSWVHQCCKRCYLAETANMLGLFPHLNAGVFAGAPDSPVWSAWAMHHQNIVKRHNEYFFFSEQVALNGAIRLERLTVAFLPAHCNFLCNLARPRIDLEKNLFVEPDLPYAPLGIIHLAANTKQGVWPVLDLSGKEHSKQLTYAPLPM